VVVVLMLVLYRELSTREGAEFCRPSYDVAFLDRV